MMAGDTTLGGRRVFGNSFKLVYPLIAMAAALAAFSLFYLAKMVPYIDCHFWIGRLFLSSLGLALVFIVLGILLRKNQSTRKICLMSLTFLFVFQLFCGVLLFKDIREYELNQGRLGSPYSGELTVDDMVKELKSSLSTADKWSAIRIEDCRGDLRKKDKITITWTQGEKIVDVLARINSNPIVKISVDVAGNSETSGFVHGCIYTIWLSDKSEAALNKSTASGPRE